MGATGFSRCSIDVMINLRHLLAALATWLHWTAIEASPAPKFERKGRSGRMIKGLDLGHVQSLSRRRLADARGVDDKRHGKDAVVHGAAQISTDDQLGQQVLPRIQSGVPDTIMTPRSLELPQEIGPSLMSTRRDWLMTAGALGLQHAAVPAWAVSAADPSPAAALQILAGVDGIAELRPVVNRHRDLLDLGGVWQFQTDATGVGEAQGWMHGLPAPRQIAVPGSWNDQWPDLATYLGAAWYLTHVELPQSWQGREIRLRIESATHAATVWFDGKRLGAHEGGHLPFEFSLDAHPELADSLRSGRRLTLAVRVEHEPNPLRVPPGRIGLDDAAGNSPNVAYDFFPYAGLDRRVLLCAVPAVRIHDYHARTRLSGSTAQIDLIVGATSNWTGRGKAWLASGTQRHEVALSFADGIARARWTVPDARLWHPADPHLYRLVIELDDAANPGRSLDVYADDLGLRTVAVHGDRLLLNGRPLRLLGFGRHEDAPGSGRGLNLPVAVQDLSLIRWTGANSFRTSHYPYSEETLRMAEREGLMVIAETPAVGLHFSDSPANIGVRLERARRQTLELIARDRNRACVVMWWLANEPMDNGFTANVMKAK